MRAYDKIKRYITTGRQDGSLRPGSRLPPYRDMMIQHGCSYATAQTACRKLQEEGLLELLHGSGVYISGTAPLKVQFYMTPTTLNMGAYSELIMRHVRLHDLHLEVELHDRADLNADELNELLLLDAANKVVLVEANAGQVYNISGLTCLQEFEGFDKIVGNFRTLSAMDYSTSLPYYFFTRQIGVNRRLLEKVGFNPSLVDGGTFDWWDALVAACRGSGVASAHSKWNGYDTWIVDQALWPFLSMLVREKGAPPPYKSKPVFDTASGRKAFEMFAGYDLRLSCDTPGVSFMDGGAAVSFEIGSWFHAQMPAHPNVSPEDFRLVPYSINGRKINFMSMVNIQTFLAQCVNTDERIRVWELLKIMVSKEFQIEFCGLTGAVSPLKGIRSGAYRWNTTADMANFIPMSGDLDVWGPHFPRSRRAALAALFAQYKFHGADLGQILKSLDDIYIKAD